MAVPDAVLELASYANLRGIDWDTLNAQGRGVLQSDDYVFVLDERWKEFYRVAETLDITDSEWEETSATEARDAWSEVLDSMANSAQAMLDALAAGELSVALDSAATIWTGALRKLVIATSAVSHWNLTAHMDGTMVYAIETGQTTVEDVQEEASSVARLWDAIVQLDGMNAFSSFKKPQYGGASGIGQAPASAAAQVAARSFPWIVGAVLVAAVICALLVFLSYLSDRNDRIRMFCFDANGNLRKDRPGWCDEPNQGMPDPLAVFLGPAKEFGRTVGTYVGIALLIYVGIYAFPRVVAAVRQARAA